MNLFKKKKVISLIIALAFVFNVIAPDGLSLSAKAEIVKNMNDDIDNVDASNEDQKSSISKEDERFANEVIEFMNSENSINEEGPTIYNMDPISIFTNVSYEVYGDAKVGNTIDIILNVDNVNDLYGGSIDFLYDTDLLEVQSVIKGDIFGANETLTPIGDEGRIANGQASFAITLRGNVPGVSNNGSLAIVKAKVLKEGTVNIKSTNSNTALSLNGFTARVKLSNSMAGNIAYSPEDKSIELLSNIEYSLNLNSISLSSGELYPEFSPWITSYSVNVPYETNKITINAAAEDAAVTIEGTGSKSLKIGTNNIIIKVLAPNGQSREYTVSVIRAAKVIETGHISYDYSGNNHQGKEFNIRVNASNVQDLYAVSLEYAYNPEVLEVIDVTLGKAFEGHNVFEQKDINNGFVKLDATMLGNVNGITADSANIINIRVKSLTDDAIYLTSAMDGIQLDPNGQNLRTKLVGADIYSSDVYFIPITCEKETSIDVLSVNNNLSNISINNGLLEPEFSKENTEYTVNVENSVKEINITAIAEHFATTVNGAGVKLLSTGRNEIVLSVTAESGDVKTYTIVVNRAASSNAEIEDVIIEGNMSFDKEEKAIIKNVSSDTDVVSLNLDLAEGATWKLYLDVDLTNEVDKDNIPVEEGQNIFYVKVIAEDGITNSVYKFYVNREIADRVAPNVVSVVTISETYLPGDNVTIIVEFDEPVMPGVSIELSGVLGTKLIQMSEVSNSGGREYQAVYTIAEYEHGDVTGKLLNVSDEIGNTHESGLNLNYVFAINYRQADVNRDGVIDLRDLAYIGKKYNAVVGDELYDINADINGDGIIDLYDITIVSKAL